MSKDVKKEQEAPEQSKEVNEFEARVKDFLVKFEALQKEYKVGLRPIITQLGPDIQFVDVKAIAKEKSEAIAKI